MYLIYTNISDYLVLEIISRYFINIFKMLFKFLILIIVVCNLQLPLNNQIDILLLGLLFALFVSVRRVPHKIKFINKISVFLVIFVITVVNFTIPKLNIHEAHSVFLTNKDIKTISNLLMLKVDIKMKMILTIFIQ